MSRWGRARRRAIAAVLVLAAPAVFVASAASADAPVARAAFRPLETGYPPAPCVQHGEQSKAERIIWDEVSRLVAAGLPACELTWVLEPPYDGSWGIAYTAAEAEGDRPLIVIDPNVATYTDDLDPEERTRVQLDTDVRTAVRHEFGHVLTYLLGYDDDELRDIFPAELEGANISESTRYGLEASAEAITQALTPPGEGRTWMYDKHVDDADVATARELLARFTDPGSTTTP
ncbi:hypothetical protein [Cellulosimicrobium sp. 22601]|uniref:hypothetical protein n=1 Tax=unclassified Cellulosimicrobium TaxID=2624466 RepID=UPI003F836D9B